LKQRLVEVTKRGGYLLQQYFLLLKYFTPF